MTPMQHTNAQRALVDRNARRSTRLVCSGIRTLRALKQRVKAAHRRQQRQTLHALQHGADPDAADYQPRALATGWDVA